MSYLKQPIEYTFDLNSKSQPKVLCVTHTDDEGVDVIKLMVTQSGNAVDLSQTIVTAVMVMRWTHELLNDNVSCEYKIHSKRRNAHASISAYRARQRFNPRQRENYSRFARHNSRAVAGSRAGA